MTPRVVRLDVREDIRKGQEPFSRIMSAVHGLGPGDQLLLLVPFEPVPLYQVLERKGFQHAPAQTTDGDWEVLFTQSGALAAPVISAPGFLPPIAEEKYEVDARGLEPPQPLIRILEAIATLPGGAELRARTDRRPIHLYAQLEERGFSGETSEEPDGSYLTLIRQVNPEAQDL